MCIRDRRERQRQRQRDRETERDRETDRETDRDREGGRQREIETEMEGEERAREKQKGSREEGGGTCITCVLAVPVDVPDVSGKTHSYTDSPWPVWSRHSPCQCLSHCPACGH